MLVKTILNRVHPLKSFVYGTVSFVGEAIYVDVTARKNSRPRCGMCQKPGPTYDTAHEPRLFAFIPLLGFLVFLVYRVRRVECKTCRVHTEHLPWATGKQRTCNVYRQFLANWARRMSWTEVATIFQTSWGVVYRSVKWIVDWGLEHRSLAGVTAIGVDEIAAGAGQRYLTVVYQIDEGVRRLLWVDRDRDEAVLNRFFEFFGKKRCKALRFVASDMWRAYLNAIAKHASQAVHVLDRYHIVAKLNEAINFVRATESKELARKGFEPVLKEHTMVLSETSRESCSEPSAQTSRRPPIQSSDCSRVPSEGGFRRLLGL